MNKVWRNIETYVVYAWIDNVDSMYNVARERAKEGEKVLRDYVEDLICSEYAADGVSISQDLALTALDRVDWAALCEVLKGE